MRFAPVPVLLFVATACSGADDATKAARTLDGEPATFPAKGISDGLKATIGAIESCHSTDWAGKKPPGLADLDAARKGDHVRLVLCKPITVTVTNDAVEVSEIVFRGRGVPAPLRGPGATLYQVRAREDEAVRGVVQADPATGLRPNHSLHPTRGGSSARCAARRSSRRGR